METNKKYFNRLAGGAMLLAGAMAFAACSSDEDFADAVNPGAGATGETVKTQFSIAVPGGISANKRLADAIVQGQSIPVFRGMDDIRIVPFDLTSATGTAPIQGTETMLYNAITLTSIAATDGLGDANSKVYSDVDIPTGTNAFLFYGKALEAASMTAKDNGALIPSYASKGLAQGDKVSEISFSLQGILGTQTVTEAQTKLLGILKGIAGTTGTSDAKWSAETGNDLAGYYTNFTAMKAGSANNILLAVQDLYNAMKSPRVEDNNGLKAAICTKIEEYFTFTDNAGNYTLAFKETGDYTTFPVKYGLPDGAVQVKWENSTFSYVTSVDYDSDDQNMMNVAALDKYVYPAALYYWANTTIKTSDTQQSTNYTGKTAWNDILSLYITGTEVTAATQSVALTNTINYAVGLFEVSAKFADGEISDKGGEIVTLPTDGFQICGLLVGGQKSVGWNFQTNTTADEQTIYDASVLENVKGVTRAKATVFKTLTLETVEATAGQGAVNFALELVNNGSEPFEGADGIVPVGGKFYLVGQLKPDDTNKKVFKQDHKTIANVTISSLKSAYNCVPDLRAPRLELGLSVDLEWLQGLSQDVTID